MLLNLVEGEASGCSKQENNKDEREKSPSSRDTGGSEAKKKKNRCAVCNKRVGLTGFDCRCGGLYCAAHRYAEKHDCTFDYKAAGAEEIRRNNPVVVGEKVKKI